MSVTSNIGRAVTRLWIFALGELQETDRPLKDGTLLFWLGLATCTVLFGSLRMQIKGSEMLRSAWLAGMHGGIPLAVLVLWWLWRTRRGDALAVLCGLSGALLVAFPTVARFVGRGSIQALKPHAPWVLAAVLLGFVLLLAAALRAKMDLSDFGLGLGDWRWWLPRAAAATLVIIVGVAVAIVTFDDLVQYYPRRSEAVHDRRVLVESMSGMFFAIFGWEMLFRGILLWVLARRGDIKGAIEANAIIFFLGHLDKPTSEMFLSLPGGIVACWFGWRAGSFVPVWLLHSLQLLAINVAGVLVKQ